MSYRDTDVCMGAKGTPPAQSAPPPFIAVWLSKHLSVMQGQAHHLPVAHFYFP